MRSVSRLLCVMAVLLTGCHSVALRTRLPDGGKTHEKTFDYFLFGILGEHQLEVDALCPKGVAAIRSEAVAWIDILTLGIYTPRKIVVQCAGVER